MGNPFSRSMGVPQPQTRMGNFVRGGLGAAAGGMAGGALLGPVGGLLGSALGRNLATGQGLLGGGGRIVTQPNSARYQQAAAASPRQSVNTERSGGFDSQDAYERAYGISPAGANAVNSGIGGLF
jgi:hypothetical protein